MAKIRRRRWSFAEDQKVRQHAWRDGVGWGRLAKELGRTRAAVVNRAAYLRKIDRDGVPKKIKRKRTRRWTAAEDRRLLALDAQRVPASKAAKVIGRSKKAVQERLLRLRGPQRSKPRKLSRHERQEMASMASAGKRPSEIAAAFRRASRTVRRVLAEQAPEALHRGQPFTPAEDDTIRAMVAAKDRVSEIARTLGRPYGSVRGRIARLGIPTRKYLWREPWKLRDLRRAAELRSQGLDAVAIGRELNRSPEAVRIALRKYRARVQATAANGPARASAAA